MKAIFMYWRETLAEMFSNANGSKIREFQREDQILKPMLDQHVTAGNGKRILFTALCTIVIAIVSAIVQLVTLNAENPAPSIVAFIGCLVLTGVSIFICMPIRNELRKRMCDWNKLNRLILIYWGVFSFGMFLIVLGDFLQFQSSQTFFLYILVMMCLPLFSGKSRLIFSGAFMAAAVVAAIAAGVSAPQIIINLLFMLGCVWLACFVYNAYCCLWISQRQLNNANERCRQITEKDGLTGMLNKKGLSKRLHETLDRGAFEKIAIIFMDIDNFRRYNQIYTDQQSDDCLYNVCNCIRIISKAKSNIISRFGGDEFVVVLEDVEEIELVAFAEQLRSSVEILGLPFEDGKVVTITVGVSELHSNEVADYSQLFKEAEENLQVAKNAGKNCVGYGGRAFRKQ